MPVYSGKTCKQCNGFLEDENLDICRQCMLKNIGNEIKSREESPPGGAGSSPISHRPYTPPTLPKFEGSGGGGGCFIATAAYGSRFADQVHFLEVFRDTILSKSTLGRVLIHLYYKVSPPIAHYIRDKALLRKIIRVFLKGIISFLKDTKS